MDDQIADLIIYLQMNTDYVYRLLGLSFIRGNNIESKDVIKS